VDDLKYNEKKLDKLSNKLDKFSNLKADRVQELRDKIDEIKKIGKKEETRDGYFKKEDGNIYKNKSEPRLHEGGDYREYDVNPSGDKSNRGLERFIIDWNTGDSYYTPDHYDTFIKIR
jgi:guanyl-specific ribonuclease Sa